MSPYGRIWVSTEAPERLLRALVLQMLYSVRSERMLMEQLEQSSVPLVRGAVSQRTGVASDSVYEAFLGRGWIEAWAGLRPAESAPAAAAYILVRMRNLQAAKV